MQGSRTMLFSLIALAIVTSHTISAKADTREDRTVRAAQSVLTELNDLRLQGIPHAMLADAKAVAIVPNVIKASFVIGARHGEGVLLVRAPDGNWHAPVFVTLTGGNVGWQVGVQSTDVVLVFKTQKSAESLLAGKLTLGADAALAAGPVGREATAGTDGRLDAEIYSYSRSRGLFAGVSIDGSVMRLDSTANDSYYRRPGPGRPVTVPNEATALAHQLASYCTPLDSLATRQQSASHGTPSSLLKREEQLRTSLSQHAPALYRLLDGPWQTYLALPSSVFVGQEQPAPEALRAALANFDTVDRDPRFRKLSDLPEFEITHSLLRQYINAREEELNMLELPPPPR